jgi:hypothetical protein
MPLIGCTTMRCSKRTLITGSRLGPVQIDEHDPEIRAYPLA